MLMVVTAGVAGWFLYSRSQSESSEQPSPEELNDVSAGFPIEPEAGEQPVTPDAEAGDVPAEPDLTELLVASKQWLVWAAAQPIETNPIHDSTGEHCAVGQAADGVWNLAGSFGTTVVRQCTVPSGRPLLIPGINQWCDPSIDCGLAGDGEHSITLNGAPVTTTRLVAAGIEVDAAASNGMFARPGPQVASMHGQWALLDPLPIGEHVIRITASRVGFAVDVTYNLTVA